MSGHPTRPSFDQFIREHDSKINAVVMKRCGWMGAQDREDMKQECLLQIWKKWPTFDWKNNPDGLVMVICWHVCVTHGKSRFQRKRRGGIDLDEVAFEVSNEEASNREWLHTKRSREEPIPEVRPYIEGLLEEDRGLVELAKAVARSGCCISDRHPGYKFWMQCWLPESWNTNLVVYHWQHRMDNARVRWENGIKDMPSLVRNDRSPERQLLLGWVRGHLKRIIKKIESGKLPDLRPCNARKELQEWKNRMFALSPTGSKQTLLKPKHTVPEWVFKPGNQLRACRWIRRNWKRYVSNIEEFGWKTWDEVQRLKVNKYSLAWQRAHADTVKKMRDRPGAIERRRKASRDWNRAHREFCRVIHRRWVEKKKADASSGIS